MANEKKIVWGKSDDNLFEFVTLLTTSDDAPNDLLNQALDLTRNTFCQDETISICSGVSINPAAAEELVELSRVTANDGLSIVAIEKSTGKVVAVLFNKLQVKPSPNEIPFYTAFIQSIKQKPAIDLINFMLEVDEKINLYEHYKTDCLLENMFLITHKNYRGKNLAGGVTEATLRLAQAINNREYDVEKYKNITIGAANAIATGNLSRHVFVDKVKYDCLLDVNSSEFVFNGNKITDILPEQKLISVVAKKIE